MIKIAYLFDNSTVLSPEERAAWNLLRSVRTIKSTRTSFQSLTRQSASHRLPHLLWWHCDSSTVLPIAALSPDVITTLRSYVQNGGSLLLSLLASQYVVDLGIEESRPNFVSKSAWNEENWAPEYSDIRGFAAYRGHPIFDGLPGGVYTWNPSKGVDFCAAFYEDTMPMQGKVVAVERQYVKVNEQRRIVTEYQIGKGRILTVGTYLFFEEKNHRFRKNLEAFASNCFTYLSEPPHKSKFQQTYWSFDPRTVREVDRSSEPIETESTSYVIQARNQVIKRDTDASGQCDSFYDVGGKRILIAGKERGGISEIWCHPLRIARDVRIAYKVGNAELRWSDELNSEFIAHPECIIRNYLLDCARIREVVFADRDLPCGAIRFQVESKDPVDIILTFKVDLRLMWPLSDTATGSLTYAWDNNLQALVISAPHPHLTAVLGSSLLPSNYLFGQFSDLKFSSGTFVGIPTNDVVVAAAMWFQLSGHNQVLNVCFAGSHDAEREAEKVYRSMATDPAKALKKQGLYFENLLRRSVQVTTPHQELNDAYNWALTSTDRFFAGTPGLGSSLMAGYGTTDEGWNGGHNISGRPGYAWYFGRDSVWTSFALLSCGEFQKVRSVLEFFGSYQDPSGKIPHEITTSGFAHYDAADSTPLYIILVGKYLKVSGDVGFVNEQFDRLLKAIEFCYSTDTDNDHLIENTNVGHGWVEGGRLFPVHSEHYLASCWAKALEEAAFVASALHKERVSRRWKKEAGKVANIVRDGFWNEQTDFYNFGRLANGTYNEEKTLLPAVGISFGFSKKERAQQCLEAYASENFSADWGTRIIGKDNPMFNPTGYHYGCIWPLFTGWASLAEFKTGRPIQGFVHAMNNLLLYNQFAGGYIEEVLHGETFQPAGVCAHQAWSESMAIQPILEGMLGLEPNAPANHLSIHPYFPPDWEFAEVKNIPLGRRRINMRMKRASGVTSFEVRLTEGKPVTISLQPYFPLGTRIVETVINGGSMKKRTKPITSYSDCPAVFFNLTKKTIVEFRHVGGVALVPPVPRPIPMQQSTGLRVINESLRGGNYVLLLEGKSGQSYSIEIIDQDLLIRSIDGGKVESQNGERTVAEVKFGSSEQSNSYVRKAITFSLDHR
jgi:glycogen debranching enzyme